MAKSKHPSKASSGKSRPISEARATTSLIALEQRIAFDAAFGDTLAEQNHEMDLLEAATAKMAIVEQRSTEILAAIPANSSAVEAAAEDGGILLDGRSSNPAMSPSPAAPRSAR